jgi:DNA ligase-1
MSDKPFRPMLASPADMPSLRWPMIGSFKLDGIRVTIHHGQAMSRSMKPIPNAWVQHWARLNPQLHGADGEIIVGAPNEPDTFRRTTSYVMSDDKADFEFTFYAFDRWDLATVRYIDRLTALATRVKPIPRVKVHGCRVLRNQTDLDTYETLALDEGYEGIMLRDPSGLYKQGRSTAREQALLKVKRHADMEAVVTGWEERMHNANEAHTNEIGRTARSSHQAGKVGMDTLGALRVRGLNGPYENVEFSVGTGLDDAERAGLWAVRDSLKQRIARVKYFPLGSKDAPRHPVFAGWREQADMS